MNARYDLSGVIGEGDAVKLSRFLDDNPGAVALYINSPGGSAPDGAAMAAAIERHGRVTGHIEGIAASAASLVAVSCYQVTIHEAAVLMLHEPSVFTDGPADFLRQIADTLDKMSLGYAGTYARHTGHPVERVLAWMKDETWLTAEEAVSLRFADKIQRAGGAKIAARANYFSFKAAPAQLLELARKNGWATVSPAPKKKETEDASL
ncbi:ATP-dependent protease ClpP, protease subunit [Roseicitreum antarcticum]|uniref:ATP-dependent protease ClpP, protease subunit n=2 Tax=Roseicitreum antarcticum TaxID=564137 RepID=A0A1H2ZVS8_9RHOB|nr:ATP-dependent protease ClpP, protease subunit [Roseicitreum antarcticum]